MNLPEKLRAQAEEFRIYAKAECLPARAEQWNEWAENCEEAAKDAERMDWLEKNEPGLRHNIGQSLDKFDTIRQCIDCVSLHP